MSLPEKAGAKGGRICRTKDRNKFLERNKRLTARRELAKERGEKLESFPRISSLSPMQMIEDEWWKRRELLDRMPVIAKPGFGRRAA